jgi:aromatic ring-cleaving dioxygenase
MYAVDVADDHPGRIDEVESLEAARIPVIVHPKAKLERKDSIRIDLWINTLKSANLRR